MEDRTLPSAFTAFSVPTPSSPDGIVGGPDGNLWFTEEFDNKIGRITPSGIVTEYAVPNAAGLLFGITSGPDGNLWFAEPNANQIGRITPSGVVSEFAILSAGSRPTALAAGPDGNVWFCEAGTGKIASITPGGVITEYSTPTGGYLNGIMTGPDGNLWFTEYDADRIGRITPSGTVTEFVLPGSSGQPSLITAGPDGNLWFTERGGQIGRISTSGAVTYFPTGGGDPFAITVGRDGNIWFTELTGNQLARITPSGVITTLTIPDPGSDAYSVTSGPDGNLWFTEEFASRVVRYSLPYVVTSTADSGPGSLRDAITQVNADTSHTLYASPSNASVDEIDFNLAWNDPGHFYYKDDGTPGHVSAADRVPVPTVGIDGVTPISSDAQLADSNIVGAGNTIDPDWAHSWWSIAPQLGLPTISNAVLINGYTQAGAGANTLAQGDNAVLKIQLDLSGISSAYNVGLRVNADNSVVRGLVLNQEPFDAAIYVTGNADQVTGDFIGTDVTGTQISGNASFGIQLIGSNALVGGTTPDARNIISGNGQSSSAEGGILLQGTGDSIQGNYVGTDVTGTKALGNGSSGPGSAGVQLSTNNETVGGAAPGAGNLISGNQTGIVAYTQSVAGFAYTIQGNLIGTDVTGKLALGNGTGIKLGTYSLIGGTTSAARNIISGNGVGIFAAYAPQALIEGNYIGTDITGTKAVLGDGDGIWLWPGDNGTVGGTDPGAGNVISGNSIGIRGFGDNNRIQGNRIGTDYTGSARIPNSIGILFQDGGNNNVIGGLVTGARNIISGNYTGIGIKGLSGASGNVIEGNYIGTDVTGTAAIPSGNGVELGVGATNNRIGGLTPAESNIITGGVYNDGFGVAIWTHGDTGPVPSRNSVLGNSIYHNTQGIRLESGANNNQAAPALSAAYSGPGFTIVTGTITSTPNSNVRVEFFANAAGDPEGRTLLDSRAVPTDSAGHGSFAAVLSVPLPPGQGLVTATATDPNGNTSEFSAGITATPLPPSSLSGVVWEDFNNDGQVDFGENGISGVTITLTGTDFLGNAVNLPQTTDTAGAYVFLNLWPGSYNLTETQPAGYLQGIDTVGTAGGSLAATDQFFVQLAQGVNGMNYNYGERPPAGGSVQHGQTAGIGFWNNKNGQALIKALPVVTNADSSVTSIANWLAATLPNTYGVHAGTNNLTGKSNADVATLFQQDFLLKGVKLDAQVLATALSVYATNATLDSTGVAAQYGFTVSGTGLGTATVNVGSNGDAFGVANNTTMTIMDLLLATDSQAVNGVLYGGNTTKRNEANNVFSAVNQAGGI